MVKNYTEYRGYVGIIENSMGTTTLYLDYIGLYRGYVGVIW